MSNSFKETSKLNIQNLSKSSKVVTIHQPDLFPWFGFFHKINKADIWIVLDDVQNNPRDAAFWGRRVKILTNNQPQWFSVPLNKPMLKGQISMSINKMTVNTDLYQNIQKLKRMVETSYQKAKYYDQYVHLIEKWFNSDSNNLMNRNMKFITEVMKILNIRTQIICSSDIETYGKKNNLLVELILGCQSRVYLSGNGASSYLDVALFDKSNIKVTFNDFTHPSYDQLGKKEFVEGLSILDMLFNVPKERIISYLNNA